MSRELRNKIAELSNRNNIELKAEVLELGIVQDIDKLNSNLKSDLKKMVTLQHEADKVRSKVFSIMRKAYDEAKTAQDKLTGKFAQYENATLEAVILFNSAKKAAKELGVDYNEVKGVKDLQKSVAFYDTMVDEVRIDVTGITYNVPNI